MTGHDIRLTEYLRTHKKDASATMNVDLPVLCTFLVSMNLLIQVFPFCFHYVDDCLTDVADVVARPL